MPAPITQVNYLYRRNLANEQKLQAGYYREVINHYGIPVIYFRYNLDYYNQSLSGTAANYIYGESPTSTYPLSAEMMVFDSFSDDSPMLKRFGIESIAKSEIYFMIDDFTETWRDIIGTPTTGELSSSLIGNIVSYNGIVSGSVINSDISGFVSGNITATSGMFTSGVSLNFIRYPLAYNSDIAEPGYYTQQIVSGAISGIVAGTIDVSGNGILTGDLSGILSYYTAPSVNHGPHFQIAPQVGDFIRFKEFDENVNNLEEYEITQILDKSLARNGINPLLKRYIWGCVVNRRDPSYETIAGTEQSETFTPALSTHNIWIENESNKIFDYTNTAIDSIDGTGSDSVYGDLNR